MDKKLYLVIEETESRKDDLSDKTMRQVVRGVYDNLWDAIVHMSGLNRADMDTRTYIQEHVDNNRIGEYEHIYVKDGIYSYSLYLWVD